MPPPKLPPPPPKKDLFTEALGELKKTGPQPAYKFVSDPAIAAVIEKACERQDAFCKGLGELYDVATKVEEETTKNNKKELATLTPRLNKLENNSVAQAQEIERWGAGMGKTLAAFAGKIEEIRPKNGDFLPPQAASIKKMLILLTTMSKWNRESAKNGIGEATAYIGKVLQKAKAGM